MTAEPHAPVFTRAGGGETPAPRLALLPWGDLIEDFLDGIGISLDDFCTRMTGGWLFGYVEALALEGIRTTIFCFSDRIDATVRRVHQPTGAEIVIIRAPAIYRRLRRHMNDPYGGSAEQMFGTAAGLARQCGRVVRHIAPYLPTPVVRLAREIHRAGCGAILCQEYEAPRFDASVVAGALLRIPVFATFQGGNWQRSAIERGVRPFTLWQSAGLIIGSSEEAARVQSRYRFPASKICRTFNPLDLSAWTPVSREAARRALGISNRTRVAVWHGRIDIRRKGLDVLLEAWRRVCSSRSRPDILLLLVGSGVDAEVLDEEIRHTGTIHLRWLREYILDRETVRGYLSAADVYVFPSRHEGFPVAPLEAMACGLPVVATSVSAISDIFGQGDRSGAVIVPAGDPVSLGIQLGRLLDDEVRSRDLGVRARRRVAEAFSPARVGSQLRAFFHERSSFASRPPETILLT